MKKLPNGSELSSLAEKAVSTARRWAMQAQEYPLDPAAELLSKVLKHPDGLDFTVAFVDGVIRPEDLSIAAKNLNKLAAENPTFLPSLLRLPMRFGAAIAPKSSSITVPVARRIFARLVGDLVVDVNEKKLGKALKRLKANGARLNVNLLGEAVLGDKHAKQRLTDTLNLLKRDDIDYVSLKVSAVVGPHNPWAFDETVAHAVKQITPIYEYAAQSTAQKFINLDMEEYHDLHLTIAVFKQILDNPKMKHLSAGIVLQAYLPDSLAAMQDLQEWAAKRVTDGGAPIKIRIVKGANLAMETVQSTVRDWPLPICKDKQTTDSNYLRLLNYAFTPEHTKNIKIGAASHNLFTQAMVWELAGERGVRDDVELEMLSGMATQQASAISKDVGQLLLYVPVVRREEYDVAIAYLVRRLEENAAEENFMSAIFHIADDENLFEREKQRFLKSVAQLNEEGYGPLPPNRHQDRKSENEESLAAELRTGSHWKFNNVADTDPSLPANIDWAKHIQEEMKDDSIGQAAVDASLVSDAKQLDEIVKTGIKGASAWQQMPLNNRLEIIHQVGIELGLMRKTLLSVAGNEAGKSVFQTDPEISEAIDFAHYYAEMAKQLDQLPGAKFTPFKLTLVTPPWNFPISIPAGGTLAALAAGSAVILKPASPTRRCGALLAEACWRAGVPKDVIQLVNLANHDLGKQLLTDPRIENVVLTGSADTASLFRRWRPDLHLLAETSGKNSIIVTPSADLDLAVQDVVNSAFGHAGQKCSAASLVILVGSVARSKRFHNQLIDSVKSLHVSWPTDPYVQMNPLTEKPGEKLLAGLTELEPGQGWAIKPRQLDDSGRLWSPGVRYGVRPNSEFHLVEYFGPILGVMSANTLEEAIEIQNATSYGLTGGIQSLDPAEVKQWVNSVKVGNAYVNRGITGAIVQRQPFGGWKRSAVGTGTKAGGPNYLFGFGTFENQHIAGGLPTFTKPVLRDIAKIGAQLLEANEQGQLTTVLSFDELASRTEFDLLHDPSHLEVEHNVLRYLPLDITIRIGKSATTYQILREISAALACGEFDLSQGKAIRSMSGNPDCHPKITFSTETELPKAITKLLDTYECEIILESDEEFITRAKSRDWHNDGRIRLIADSGKKLAAALEGSIDVAIFDSPTLASGRVAILPYIHEQALSMTNHRFGNRTPILNDVLS